MFLLSPSWLPHEGLFFYEIYLELPELATLTHSSQKDIATALFMLLSPQETEVSHRLTV